jgi:uncharacterized protein
LALYFLDTSAVVKLYIDEAGTDRLVHLVRSGKHRFVLQALTQVEFRSAIRKRERINDISPSLATESIELCEQDLTTLFAMQSIDASILQTAKSLVDRYGLRGYDSVQLASCVALERAVAELPIFVCADLDLLRAAASEGLEVLNPTD